MKHCISNHFVLIHQNPKFDFVEFLIFFVVVLQKIVYKWQYFHFLFVYLKIVEDTYTP